MSPDVPILRCASCGAPIGENDLQCPYCHAEVATVACPKCFAVAPRSAHFCPACGVSLLASQPEAAPALPCPSCRKPMPAHALAGTHLHSCEACGGVWLSEAVLAQLAGDREERATLLAGLPGAIPPVLEQDVHYRPCPVCARLMNRQNYARVSGVIVDTCRDHGTWFDRDELRRVLAFIEAGGMSKARARELQDLETARARKSVDLLPTGDTASLFPSDREDPVGDFLFGAITKFLI